MFRPMVQVIKITVKHN